jgi:glycerophosphoryl diester phosphodiesterase
MAQTRNGWLVFTLAVAVAAFSYAGVAAQDSEVTPPKATVKPFFRTPLLLGAHRGGADLRPENTVVAFQHVAGRWPGALLETDAQLTADGEVVLLHDATADRTTDGTGPVAKMTLPEVKKLDAGYRFSPDEGKTFPYRGKGAAIPTLAEALKGSPSSRFLIELKGGEGITEAVVKVVRALKAEDRVLLASFDARRMQRVREMAPEIPTCYDFLSGARLLVAVRGGKLADYKPEADVLSLDVGMIQQFKLTPDELRLVRRKGIFVQVHTLNGRDQIDKYLKIGVDSILSDRPDLLADAITARNARSGNSSNSPVQDKVD